jgi:hypothetical protein
MCSSAYPGILGRSYIWATRNRHSNNQENNHPLNSNQEKSAESIMIRAKGHDPTLQRRRHLQCILSNRGTLDRNRVILLINRGTPLRKGTHYLNKDTMLGQSNADAEAHGLAV